MKALILILMIMPIFSIGQNTKDNPANEQDTTVMQGMDSVPGAGVSELDKRAKYFLAMEADIYNKVIGNRPYTLTNTTVYSDGAYIMGKARTILYIDFAYILEINIKIEFKKEKYRYKFTDYRVIEALQIEGKKYSKNKVVIPSKEEINTKLMKELRRVEADLNATMKQGIVKDTW